MADLKYYLGGERIEQLWKALSTEYRAEIYPLMDTKSIIAVIVVTLAPVLLTACQGLQIYTNIPLPTIAFGISTLLAIVMRSRFNLKYEKVSNWRHALSLTHTAFALGCIPAILMILIYPDSLAHKQETVAKALNLSAEQDSVPVVMNILFMLFIAAWASITEEFLFRGLLQSSLRRWTLLTTQRSRNIISIVCSSLFFGFAHYTVWGLAASIALSGLGFGFALAYMANGEKLSPLILYHFGFDLLSILSAALLA